MPKPEPYLHISSGLKGWIGIFGFTLKSLSSSFFTNAAEAERHIRASYDQQIDFANMLHRKGETTTFEIRILAFPSDLSCAEGDISIVFFARQEAQTKELVRRESGKLIAEVRFLLNGVLQNYEFSPIADREVFKRLWHPFPTRYIAEIRRREELLPIEIQKPHPSLRPSFQTSSSEKIYLVHSYIPTLNTLSRLYRLFLFSKVPLVYSVLLRPTSLLDGELEAFDKQISLCESVPQVDSPLLKVFEKRARAVSAELERCANALKDAPFLLGTRIWAPGPLPYSLTESIGVELTRTGAEESRGTVFPIGGYDIIRPSEDETDRAAAEIQAMEMASWGGSQAPSDLRRLRALVDAREAQAAFRLPLAINDELIGLNVLRCLQRPIPKQIAVLSRSAGREMIAIGKNDCYGEEHDIVLQLRDRLQHMYCVGQTGTGKTSLLKSMILSDIEAGHGVIVIDPHGDLFKEVLSLIPDRREEDVVVLDPTDDTRPIGINLLECQGDRERHNLVREICSIIRRLHMDRFGPTSGTIIGPIFFLHVQMIMLLVMSDPERPGSLLDFYDVFQGRNNWKKWLPLKWQSPLLSQWTTHVMPSVNYLDRYEGLTLGEYISSKFQDFVFDPQLRYIFAQRKSTIRIKEILDKKKILLVNLARGELTETNSRFLGMLLMSMVMNSAMERIRESPESRIPAFLYVDEFQNLATENFVNLLSESRKFGLGLVLANQFVSQIEDPRIQHAIFGNVGTLVSFRVGQKDAEILLPQFTPQLTISDLTNLPNWSAYMKTAVDGRILPPFSLQTVLPKGKADELKAARIRSLSREKYGVDRTLVEKEMNEIYIRIKHEPDAD